MMGYGWDMGTAGWIFMGLFWFLVIGVIVWAIAGLLPGRRAYDPGRERPEEMLDRRFAQGEIDAEQYRSARETLAAARGAKR